MRDLFRGALSVDSANPNDTDVLSFFKQLLVDAGSASPLSTVRNFLAGEIARRILSGNFSNPTDANVVDFWNQLTTDANAGSAMGTTAQYQTMKKALVGAFSCEFFNPTQADILSYFVPYSSFNFATLFTGSVFFVVQGDRGVASTGGVVTGVTDQSASIAFSSTNAGQRPSVGAGFNGRSSIVFDGVSNELHSSIALPAPGVTPFYLYAIFKPTTKGSQANYIGGGSGGGVVYSATGNVNNLTQGASGVGNVGSMTNALTRVYAEFTGTIADRLKSGSNAFLTGANSGNGTDTVVSIGAITSGLFAAQMELVLGGMATGVLSAPALSAIDAQANTYWGGVII